MGFLRKTFTTHAPCSTVFIRLMLGGMLVSEGIQKLPANHLGDNSYPDLVSLVPGGCEIICGALLILGMMTRLAVFPMIVGSLLAIVYAKTSSFQELDLWQVVRDAPTELPLLFGGTFLLIVGAGHFSFDALLAGRDHTSGPKRTIARPRAWAGLDIWM